MKSFDRDAGGFSRENLRKDEDGANAVVAACRAMKEEAMALHDARVRVTVISGTVLGSGSSRPCVDRVALSKMAHYW
jgi:hypothetical protein